MKFYMRITGTHTQKTTRTGAKTSTFYSRICKKFYLNFKQRLMHGGP